MQVVNSMFTLRDSISFCEEFIRLTQTNCNEQVFLCNFLKELARKSHLFPSQTTLVTIYGCF